MVKSKKASRAPARRKESSAPEAAPAGAAASFADASGRIPGRTTTVGGAGNLSVQVVVHALGNRPGSRFCGARAEDDRVRAEPISGLGALDRLNEYRVALEELTMAAETVAVTLAELGLEGLIVEACSRCTSNLRSGHDAARRVLHGEGAASGVARSDEGEDM